MKYRPLIALIFLLPLMACKETAVLYSDLSEREANEMLALLLCAGMSAEKTLVNQKSGNQVSYAVDTDKESFANAMMLLEAKGLPRRRYPTMSELVEKQSPVSSSMEETAKLNHALSVRLSETISSIDGVTVARVHLALPKKSLLTGDVQASSAAVLVKHRDTVSLGRELTKIKALVVDSIENLAYEDVTVVFSAEKPLINSGDCSVQPLQARGSSANNAPVVMMQVLDATAWLFMAAFVLVAAICSFLYPKFKPVRLNKFLKRK